MVNVPLIVAGVAPIVAEVYHVAPHGSDSNAATLSSPLATLHACISKLSGPGDECRLASGRYTGETITISNIDGTEEEPVVISGAPGSEVMHDGTEAIPSGGWASVGNGIWKTKLPEDMQVYQLWVDGEMMTPARWPNALWSDKSVFDWTRWSSFDKKASWGPFPKNTPDPITFTDVGDLAKVHIDATGAMFIGNIAHMDTFAGVVTSHTKGSNAFDVQLHVNSMGNTKVGNSIYFLEGLPSFIDQPDEWSFDSSSKTLWLKTQDGQSPASHDVRHKIQTYAINITNAKNVKLKNMQFFGTTLNAHTGIDGLSLESLEFRYPSSGKRMLGDWRGASPTVIADKGSTFTVFNCSWYGAEGLTMNYQGTSPVFKNNLWEYNDWTGLDRDTHSGLGGWILDASGGANDLFEHNSMLNNGPSVAYTCGKGSLVRMNRLVAEADIQNDGALIQVRSGAATNTVVEQNWMYNSAKGLRLDSGSNSAFCPTEVNNTITRNVAMGTNGMMLKNDYNFYTGNMALWGPFDKPHGASPSCTFRVDTGRFDTENAHSIVEGNVADSACQERGVTRTGHENVYDAEIESQLRDPRNLDFRPRSGSLVDHKNAGAYVLGDTQYWIPGRQEWRASVPVPPHGTLTAKSDLDLMFLPAYGCDKHNIYLGGKRNKMSLQGSLVNGDNIWLQQSAFQAGKTYYWRVDAVTYNGDVIPGAVWNFTVDASEFVLV